MKEIRVNNPAVKNPGDKVFIISVRQEPDKKLYETVLMSSIKEIETITIDLEKAVKKGNATSDILLALAQCYTELGRDKEAAKIQRQYIHRLTIETMNPTFY